jgi:cell volume regulation protein A
MLVAACLGSTDAGATLSVLSSVSRYVPARVRSLLEFESSVNDPAAILFLLLVVGLSFTKPEATQAINDVTVTGIAGQIQAFIKSIGSGIMVGLILTYLGQYILRHFITSKDQILIVGIAISVAAYGLATLLLGSGFIAAYVTGLFLANNIYDNPLITSESLENSLESFNTMMETLVFLLFGVIIHPSNILLVLPEGIACAVALMLVARPLSVLAFSGVSPFNWRENVLIAWCGLRGAVPLALSYTVSHAIPQLPGIDANTTLAFSGEVEGLIFLVVLLNLSLQGLTLPLLSRRLGLRGEDADATPALG